MSKGVHWKVRIKLRIKQKIYIFLCKDSATNLIIFYFFPLVCYTSTLRSLDSPFTRISPLQLFLPSKPRNLAILQSTTHKSTSP